MKQSKKELEAKMTRKVVKFTYTNRAETRKKGKFRVRNSSVLTVHPKDRKQEIKKRNLKLFLGKVKGAWTNKNVLKRVLSYFQ